MKVKDLIAQLSKLDQNLEIYCYEDGPVPIEGSNPGPFDITTASVEWVVRSRDDLTNKAIIKFEGEVPGAIRCAIVGITPDV
ncbi:hypothetical protein HUX88_29010 [Duganella sp. BJB1802]|uniref:hypothetical protein n=1 Tax=Duganella sp. BJB1802 TaxID=2744575 RepID=UPI00159343F2|nr:hypothetical protein [Duganella sp. BJB1802]NVD74528.1 hypothetical protein [Duganella sp. BJB1802]